jgi:predicted dienelactone hydrolase
VAAPDHADALLCHIVLPPTRQHPVPQPNFVKPETWSDASFADRRRDLAAVIDGLLADPEFQGVIDATHIGAAGHSLGGYTVVGMAGGWPGWADERIRAVLALSPYVLPFEVQRTLPDIRVPLMYQGGTADIGITPFLGGPKGAYAEARPPAYFVELKQAGHFAWVDCGKARTTTACFAERRNARLIADYGIAFFDRYLKSKPSPLLAAPNPALAGYAFKLQSP